MIVRRVLFLAATLVAPLAAAQPGVEGEPPPPPPAEMREPQPPPPPPGLAPDVAPAPTRTPGAILPNMLPSRTGATIDFRGDYTHYASDTLLGDTFLSFDLYGQYISPQGYGGYIQLPYYYASGNDESQQGLGSIELGGLYKMPAGTGEMLLRGGIALDSAGQLDSLLSTVAHLAPRLYDAYPTGLLTNWLRAEGSYRHADGKLRLAVSVGADVPFGGSDDFQIKLDALAKVAVSVGYEEPGGIGFGIGFSMLQALGTDEDDDDNNVSALNATLSFPLNPTTVLYGAFGLPDLENNIDEFEVFAIGVGVRSAIQ